MELVALLLVGVFATRRRAPTVKPAPKPAPKPATAESVPPLAWMKARRQLELIQIDLEKAVPTIFGVRVEGTASMLASQAKAYRDGVVFGLRPYALFPRNGAQWGKFYGPATGAKPTGVGGNYEGGRVVEKEWPKRERSWFEKAVGAVVGKTYSNTPLADKAGDILGG